MNRRQLLSTTGFGLMAGAVARAGVSTNSLPTEERQSTALSLSDYEPKSMLRVHASHVERVSTGLLGTQVGLQPMASQMLAAADAVAP